MSDFDSEKKDGQARPDYYQPNQNAGGTYYNPPQNEQAQDSNTTYHYSYANNNQQAGSNYYKPPQNDNNSQNENSPKPPKKNKAGKIVAIILVICAFVAVVGIVLGATGVIDGSKNSVNNNSTSQSQDSSSDVKTNDSNSVETKDSSGNLTVAGVAQKVMDSCVGITVYSQQQEAYNYFYNYGDNSNSSGSSDPQKSGEGSGVIMSESNGKTYILTCAHVISGGTKFTVTLNNKKEYDATMVAYDSQTDIGVLSINATGLQVAEFANSDNLAVGEQVVAIGNALGYGQSVTTGIVSAKNRQLNSDDTVGDYDSDSNSATNLIQTDAAINPGNSGGALLNVEGQVIGINSAKYSDTAVEGMGYAIPMSKAEPIINDLINREAVDESESAYLGISGADITDDVANTYNMPNGIYVTKVAEGSAAEKAGIQKGDILTEFDGKEVTSMENMQEILKYYKAGKKVKVKVQVADNGTYKEKELTVKLGKRPSE